MNMENIPTPETDALSETMCRTAKMEKWRNLSRDLERRLAMARGALDESFRALTSVTVKTRSEGEILQSAARNAAKALTQTAPKQ